MKKLLSFILASGVAAGLSAAEREITESCTLSGTVAAGDRLVVSNGAIVELADNVFEAGSTLVLSNATIQGFAAAANANVTLPCAIEIAPDTENTIRNFTDSYSQEGCNVTMTGAVSGSGTLDYVSTGRGFYLNGDYSEFTGVINLEISAKNPDWFVFESTGIQSSNADSVWNFLSFPARKALSVSGNGGSIPLGNFCSDATIRSDNGWNPSISTGNRPSGHVWAGKFENGAGSFSSFDALANTEVTIDCDLGDYVVHALPGATLRGNGTIGTLQTWENTINVANDRNSILLVHARAAGDTGAVTITGDPGLPSGNAILDVDDPADWCVSLSGELADAGWRLKCVDGLYSIFKPGFIIYFR